MDKRTAKAIKRLQSNFPLLGPGRRIKAAKFFVNTSLKDAVQPLIDNLSHAKADVTQQAYETLKTLHGSAQVRFCEIWAQSRNRELEKILLECGYVATSPEDLKILTCLKQNKPEKTADVGKSGVEKLLALREDKDTIIAKNARKALKQLSNVQGINHLCSLWPESRDPELEAFILAGGYVATAPEDLKILTCLKQNKPEKSAQVGKSGVEKLLALREDKDTTIAKNARKALKQLSNIQGINHLCSLWPESRDPELEAFILAGGYVATSPEDLKILTCLKQNKPEKTADVGKSGVEKLLILRKDKDTTIAKNARKALKQLSNVQGINHLCSLWSESRHPELEAFILAGGYVATAPEELHALTCFLNNKEPRSPITDKAVTVCLKQGINDIQKRLLKYLAKEASQNMQSRILEFILAHPTGKALGLLNQKGWYPQDPAERSLFYFLAQDLESYFDLDFDQSQLRIWYETGTETLKEAIAALIRQSGDSRLLTIFRTERGGRKEDLSADDIAVQVEILLKNSEFDKLFTLLAMLTYETGAQVIRTMRQTGWQNPDNHGRALQERLYEIIPEKIKEQQLSSFSMRIYEDFRPMFLGIETPPESQDQLSTWLKDKKHFRRRSAALISWGEKGLPGLADAADAACGDLYWQVRMAAAACELLHPGTLSPANKAALEDDHVYWVQALIKMPSEGRLLGMTPEDIEQLKQKGRQSSPDHKPVKADDFFDLLKGLIPSQEKEYLLALAEYLGTDIHVSTESGYDAGNMDVEIEVE